MGCDVHAHIEIKLNGVWEHLRDVSLNRDYHLFSMMADVRNDGKVAPIASPRGLPDDITNITKFNNNVWDGDGHSHSYINIRELIAVENYLVRKQKEVWDSPALGYFFGNHFSSFLKYPEDCPQEITDIRMIFWFDN